MAVDTIVWSRLDSSMPAIRALKMIQIRRWVSRRGGALSAERVAESVTETFLVRKERVVVRRRLRRAGRDVGRAGESGGEESPRDGDRLADQVLHRSRVARRH